MEVLYRTMSPKNYVILKHNEETDTYIVSVKLWGRHEQKEYSHYNHATFAFQNLHDKIVKLGGKIRTNLK